MVYFRNSEDIFNAAMEDEYFWTVAPGFLREAIETARKESKSRTIMGILSYIKNNLI